MKRYFSIIIGCLLIAVSYNVFFIPNRIIPNGILGLSLLLKTITNFEPAILILIINSFFLLLAISIFGIKKCMKYILPSLLIPIFILLTKKIIPYVKIDLETILIVISGSFLMGYASSLIYKEGLAFGFDILQDIINNTREYKNKNFVYTIEVVLILMVAIFIDFEICIYSAISIVIILYMTTKSKIGISSSKTFYIITYKANEIKDYLINELKYDYTEISVKGGFSHQKQEIIMTVIDTKDYYKVKEGINEIDPKAFISIIDNYESINKNLTISSKKNES